MSKEQTLEELGFDKESQMGLIADAARYAAFHLAARERGKDWKAIGSTMHPVGAIGGKRWESLSRFAVACNALNGVMVSGGRDEEGPFVPMEEMARLGGIILAQWEAQDPAAKPAL